MVPIYFLINYQFIRLFCLYKYKYRQPVPSLDENFILYCIRSLGTRDNRGVKSQNIDLQNELALFYELEFKHLLTHTNKHDLRLLTQVMSYLATQIHTGIMNNLKEHFVTRLLRFINQTTPDYEIGLDKKQAETERRLLKNALLSNDPSLIPTRYFE